MSTETRIVNTAGSATQVRLTTPAAEMTGANALRLDTPQRLINPARAYQLENGTNVLAFGYDRQAVSLVAAQNVAGQPKTYEWDKSKGAYVSALPADPKLVAALNARLDVADAHARLALQVVDAKAAIGAGVTVKRDGADLIVKFAKNEAANKLLTGLRGTEQAPGQAVQWDKFANGYRVGVTSVAAVTTTINKLNEISTTLAKQELSAAQSANFSNPSSLVHTTIKDGKIVASFQKDPIANGFAKDAGGAYTKGTYVFSPATDAARTAVVEAMVKIDQHFNSTYLLAPGPATAEGRGADGIAPPSPEIAAVIAMPSEERLAALSANLDLADSVEAYNRQIAAVLNKHPDLQAAVQAGDRDAVTNLGLNNDQAQDLIQAFQDTTYALEDVKTQMMEQAQAQTQAQTPQMAM